MSRILGFFLCVMGVIGCLGLEGVVGVDGEVEINEGEDGESLREELGRLAARVRTLEERLRVLETSRGGDGVEVGGEQRMEARRDKSFSDLLLSVGEKQVGELEAFKMMALRSRVRPGRRGKSGGSIGVFSSMGVRIGAGVLQNGSMVLFHGESGDILWRGHVPRVVSGSCGNGVGKKGKVIAGMDIVGGEIPLWVVATNDGALWTGEVQVWEDGMQIGGRRMMHGAAVAAPDGQGIRVRVVSRMASCVVHSVAQWLFHANSTTPFQPDALLQVEEGVDPQDNTPTFSLTPSSSLHPHPTPPLPLLALSTPTIRHVVAFPSRGTKGHLVSLGTSGGAVWTLDGTSGAIQSVRRLILPRATEQQLRAIVANTTEEKDAGMLPAHFSRDYPPMFSSRSSLSATITAGLFLDPVAVLKNTSAWEDGDGEVGRREEWNGVTSMSRSSLLLLVARGPTVITISPSSGATSGWPCTLPFSAYSLAPDVLSPTTIWVGSTRSSIIAFQKPRQSDAPQDRREISTPACTVIGSTTLTQQQSSQSSSPTAIATVKGYVVARTPELVAIVNVTSLSIRGPHIIATQSTPGPLLLAVAPEGRLAEMGGSVAWVHDDGLVQFSRSLLPYSRPKPFDVSFLRLPLLALAVGGVFLWQAWNRKRNVAAAAAAASGSDSLQAMMGPGGPLGAIGEALGSVGGGGGGKGGGGSVLSSAEREKLDRLLGRMSQPSTRPQEPLRGRVGGGGFSVPTPEEEARAWAASGVGGFDGGGDDGFDDGDDGLDFDGPSLVDEGLLD